ncbi:hypothetical protein [Methylorubrum populi]|uniref:hypothetical protein n=1 Tax=Methylorubrum populi TaxID=223967 RepID=UPI002F35A54F
MPRGRESLGLYPLRDLRRAPDGAWRATGPDPVFALGPATALAAFSGSRIRVRCRPEDVRPVLAVEAEGESEPRRYRLTPRPEGTDDVIRLPAGTRALRIEAVEAGSSFRLDAVRIEPVGRITAGFHAARAVLERLPPQERRPLRLLRRAWGLLRAQGWTGGTGAAAPAMATATPSPLPDPALAPEPGTPADPDAAPPTRRPPTEIV